MDSKIEKIKTAILGKGLIREKDRKIISPIGSEEHWLFDLRNVFLTPDILELIAEIFWSRFEKYYPFQVGGQELAAVPLATAIALRGLSLGKPINYFIIRKSRKKVGLQNLIEGELNNKKIVLVDDLINSGTTILRQIKALEDIDKKVSYVFSLIRFRDNDDYKYLTKTGLKIDNLFSLKDFDLSINEDPKEQKISQFKVLWRFQSPEPNYFYVIPKSAPVLDENKIYFGSDNRYFWALNQKDGTAAWNLKVGPGAAGKSIFSSPCIWKNTIYFGAYDGNVYALDAESGKLKWKFMEADWVGSSPAVADNIGLLFIGLEFGLFNKRGGIAALDLKTGEKKWEYKIKELVHCSPVYNPKKQVVAIGDNGSCAYLFDARNGKLKWKYETGGEIKSSLVFDDKRNLVIFGSYDGNLYALDIDSGELKGKFKTDAAIYSTPLVYGGNVYFSSLDKNIYSVNLDSGNLNWKFATSGRIFSSPIIIGEMLYVGSNDGRLYEIDLLTGKLNDFFQASERIVNKIAFNKKSGIFFVPTFANEIYCLSKIKNSAK